MYSRNNLITGAGFAIAIALMAVLTSNATSALRSVQNKLDQVVSVNTEKERQISIMRRSNRERIISLQRMLILDDPFDIDEERMRHLSLANSFITARMKLYDMTADPTEVLALDKIREKTLVAAPLNDKIRSLALSEEQDKARTLMLEELRPAQNAIYEEFESLARIYANTAKAANEEARNEQVSAQKRMNLTLAMAICVSLLIALHVIRISGRAERAAQDHRVALESDVNTRTEELKKEVMVREQAEKLAQDKHERLRVTLASIADGVLTVSPQGHIEYLNPAAETLIGIRNEEATEQHANQLLRITQSGTGQPANLLLPSDSAGSAVDGENSQLVLERSNGSLVDIEATVADICATEGRIDGTVIVLRDVSETRALARKLAFQASHDPLTGLINRRKFEHEVTLALADSTSFGYTHTLGFLDLDQFKVINDTCGHAVGDRLLRELSERISAQLRDGDILARLGGDEFGILLRQCDVERGEHIAESIIGTVSRYRLVHEDQALSVGVSIGLLAVHKDTGDVTSVMSLADIACYTAKESGRNCVQVYRDTDDVVAKHQVEMRWSIRLRQAMDDSQFELHCQPIVSTRAGIATHYEILLRLRGQNGELICPGAFLPAAERYGLLTRLDRHVIDKILAWLGEHPKAVGMGRLSVNVSGASISDRSFLEHVARRFSETRADPRQVIFEVTENVAITNTEAAVRFMTTLGELGCEFALDDFGRGFSSLGSLKDLPIDYLKIDGGFISNILRDETDEATVRGINEIAHALGKRTIAEYVENSDIHARIGTLGVDFAQGFGIARPRPIDEVLLWDQESQVVTSAHLTQNMFSSVMQS